ncbi:MAG: DNA-directed RNA polymerase [Candidatus Woesearchaeota archaeon]
MFYNVEIKDHIRVPPDMFGLSKEESLVQKIKHKYEGFISRNMGIVIDVLSLGKVGEGIIVPGDGAVFYEVTFELLTFEPEIQEVVLGSVKDIADFGVFMTIGPIEGMIHVSQTMDDFVSFSKDKALQGKDTKRTLKVGDKCKARIIAVSYKDVMNPKIGLTMRQGSLGKLEWIQEDKNNKK